MINPLLPENNRAAARTLCDALLPLFSQALHELIGDALPEAHRVPFQKTTESALSSPDSRTLAFLWREHGQYLDPAFLDALEVPENQEWYREWVWASLRPQLQEISRSPGFAAFRSGIKKLIQELESYQEEITLESNSIGTLAEWEATQEEYYEEMQGNPAKTLEALKVKDAFASYEEIKTLFRRTTESDVAADVVSFLWQGSNRPDTLTDLIPKRSLVNWAVKFTKMPVKDISTQEDGIKLALEFIRLIASGEVSQTHGIPRLIAAHLRSRYGLGKARNIKFIPLEESLNEAVFNGYEDVEVRMNLDAIHASAPPAQGQAMDFQLEADHRDLKFAQVCREHGKDPNGMRNNLQALKVKLRQN